MPFRFLSKDHGVIYSISIRYGLTPTAIKYFRVFLSLPLQDKAWASWKVEAITGQMEWSDQVLRFIWDYVHHLDSRLSTRSLNKDI